MRNRTFSTDYPTRYSFCVPDCKQAHQSFMWTQNGTCDSNLTNFVKFYLGGGEYCASSNWQHGCELSAPKTVSPNKWTVSTAQNQIPSHYSSIVRESDYTGSCTSTTVSTNCNECSAGLGMCTTTPPSTTCEACLDDPYYPGISKCEYASETAAGAGTCVGTTQTNNACRDGYIDSTGKCVTNCGAENYGAITASPNGAVLKSTCASCTAANCYECVGATQCISCKSGYYLLRNTVNNTWGDMNTYGTCVAKVAGNGNNNNIDVYVKSEKCFNNTWSIADYFADLKVSAATRLPIGKTSDFPFPFLSEAITKAYELGAQYTSATVTISLMHCSGGSDKNIHYMRRMTSTEPRYIPTAFDNQQTTTIIIEPQSYSNGYAVQIVQYKLKDRFTFPVGAGLTVNNIVFDGLDSLAYYDYTTPEIETSMEKSQITCTLKPDKTLDKCATKQPAIFWTPTDNCLMTSGMGSGLFTFDLSSQSQMTVIPTLTLNGVTIQNFNYNFNSLIELNSYGGKVVITNSVIQQINSCGAIIRNSHKLLSKTFTPSVTSTYTDYYTERSSRFLYETYSTKYAPFTSNPLSCPSTGCFAITITGTTFTNFGAMKAPLTTPVTVNPSGGLQYTGHILDLNNFDGPVIITGSTFSLIGVKYSSCSVIVPLLNAVPGGADAYPSFGPKTKYQIKSLISIIGQNQSIDIVNNTFTDNSGTKGIIYLDINHSQVSRRLILGGNTFLKNSGFLGSNVIYVRSRGPDQATSLYLNVPSNGNLYCSGFLFQGNTFTSNYGCQQSAGGVIKFECLDSTEVSALANDVITLAAPLDAATATSYQGILFSAYTVIAEPVTYGAVTYTVDRQMTTFKLNTYTKNTASGGMGLVDISGAPRISISQENYTNNGDSQSQLTTKMTTAFPFVDNPATADTLLGAFTSTTTYAPSTLMTSLINIERTSQVIISTMNFTSNWMIENTQCDFTRAQLFTFSQLYGQLSITVLTVLDHKGPSSNTYLSESPISLSLSSGLSATQKLGSRVPFFRFSNSVFLTVATFTQWQFKNINFYEDPLCPTNMFFSFPGESPFAHVEDLKFTQASATVATFDTVNCFLCTQPTMVIGEALTVLIQNINYKDINQLTTTTYPSQNSLIQFKLHKPYRFGSGTFRTEMITLNTVEVNTYQKSTTPSQGRLFQMIYVNPPVGSTEEEPISAAQVIVNSCKFTTVSSTASGTFAQVDLKSIQMLINSTSFTTFSGDTSSSFGGVIYAISLGALTLTNVTAKTFKANDAPSSAGGGGFLYINQDAPFSLTINGASSFYCSLSTYTPFLVQSLQYLVGSAFQLISVSYPFTVSVIGSNFNNCFGANQGGVFSMSSSSSVISFNLQDNIFVGNSALNGGSIYCFNCYMTTNKWFNNQFSNGYANNGGDVYLQNLVGQTSFTLDTQIHLNSLALTSGGAFFYQDDSEDINIFYLTSLNDLNTATSTTGTGSGGAFDLFAPLGSISFSATSTVFTSCTSKLQGGLFNMNALKDISLSLTNSNIKDASSGVGGIAYINGSSSTITVEQTALPTDTTPANLLNTQATTGDGGLFYSTVSSLSTLLVACKFTLTNTTISTSKALLGRGGVYFCQGLGSASLSLSASVIKSSTGNLGGGAFYLSMTSHITLSITDTLISDSKASGCFSCFSSTGGFASLQTTLGDVLVNLIGTNAIGTQIDQSQAQNDGGMMYLNGAVSNKIQLTGLLSFTSSTSTLGEGGFAKMTGTKNTFIISPKTTINQCNSGKNGGCFMMAGTLENIAKFEGDNTNFPTISNLKVTGSVAQTYNGGLIYLRGNVQSVSIKNINLQSSTVKGNGGVIYSEVASNIGGAQITIIIAGVGSGIQQLSGMTAVGSPTSHGSFLYVSALNNPTLTLTIEKTVIKCMSQDFCVTNQTYGPVYQTLNQTIIPPNTLIGGLFYFELGVKGTISTTGCIFGQCYTTTEGSVFYLNGGLDLTDNNSNFTGNAGLKGQIYCNQCTATLQGSKFQCMISQQGSLIWIDSGTTTSTYSVAVVFSYAAISSGRSIGDGGAVYAQGNLAGSIKFIQCAVMTLFETPLSGGFFYIGNPLLTLDDKTGSNWNHIYVGKNGSLVEGGGVNNVTPDASFSIPCKLGNITGGDPVYPCSFVSGGLDVVGCQISCGSGIIDTATLQAQQIQLTAGKYSLYSFKSKTVLTQSNTINNCLAVNGAVYNLIDSTLTDINSTFSYNGAAKGGVAYCSNCNMTFIDSKFIGNFATQGGTFFIQDRGILTLENVVIQGSSAQTQGGLIYGAGYQQDMTTSPSTTSSSGSTAPIIFPYVKINITQTPVSGVYLSFGDFKSAGDGGAIYIQNGVVTINNMNINGSSAAGNGGFLYTIDQVQVSIENSVFTNLTALNGGFVSAFNSSAVPQLLPSTIAFVGSNSFTNMSAAYSGGCFYLSNPGLQITLNTSITIQNSTAIKGDGGVFYIDQLNFIDFRQSNPLLIANYNSFSASKGQRGSFLYSSAIGVSIYLENINLNCRNATPEGGVQAYLPVTAIIQYAGAIYVQDALFINSQQNTFQNCYGADIGGIFTINTVQRILPTPFQELGSTYINNHAQNGGVINCLSCTMSITGTPSSVVSFTQSAAQQGGVIYIASTTVSTITGVIFSNNIATQGGVIAAVNTTANSYLQQGYLYVSNCIFQTQSSQGDGGGAFYLNTNQLSYFNLSSSSVISSKSGGNGGFFIVGYTVKQPNSGSLYYSSNAFDVNLVIKQSQITCNSTYNSVDAVDSLNAKLAYVAGAIYLKQSKYGLFSSDNQYKQCHLAQDGGAFHIVSSIIIEQKSVFSLMSSLYGAVFKCSSCSFNFTDSVLDYSQAVSGGALMMEDNADGTFTNTSFKSTKATNTGGLLSITQGGNPLINSTVYFLNCPNMIGNQAQTGGVFYIDQPNITVHLTNVNIQGSQASQQGGVVQMQSGNGFILQSSVVINVFSPSSSVFYSTSNSLKLQILSSQITCNPIYTTYLADITLNNPLAQAPNVTNAFYISGTQQTIVKTVSSTFQKCGIFKDGGLFKIQGYVNFDDTSSVFTDNSAIEGGVISCSQCNINLLYTKFQYNQAKRGGVIKLESSGNLISTSAIYINNYAVETGGVFYVMTQSVFNLRDTLFESNVAATSSTIDVLGASSTLINKITNCTFQYNRAVKNTISLNTALATISGSFFKNNYSKIRSKNIFIAFAKVNVTDCQFFSDLSTNTLTQLAAEQTMGAFINIILDVTIYIKNSIFTNGLASYGGAIYISGQSKIIIDNCIINNNMANVNGGAIFASGFASISVIGGTTLSNNIANSAGDDFFLTNTDNIFTLEDVQIENPNAQNSIYAETVTVQMNRVRIYNIFNNPLSLKGAALYCYGCRGIKISGSTFSNLVSQAGAAIYITDFPTNKRAQDESGKYFISNTIFLNNTAFTGGSIYLNHPQMIEIQSSTFTNNAALNTTKASSPIIGVGGAIYYTCSAIDNQCSLKITGPTNFNNNFAQIKGGAIHWDYHQPSIGSSVKFRNNKAAWYGDNLSSYSQQLMAVSLTAYSNQISKINYPLTLEQFQAGKTSGMQRQLQTSNVLNSSQQESFLVPNSRSGSVIPDFQLAHVDMYGQIVNDFDSKIRVSVDSSFNKIDDNTKTYTAVLEGTTQFTSYGGVAQGSGLQFTGAPGYNYRLQFLTNGIDETLPQNEKFMQSKNQTNIQFNFVIELRNCTLGEYFSQAGKCIYCDKLLGYSLLPMTQPGECTPCPIDSAQCKGGPSIGPLPGYWRRSNTSSNFIKCYNEDACLGWVEPDFNPMGACSEGQYGILCAQCMPGYSLTGLAKCGKCPELVSNIVKMVGLVILITIVFVLMVKSSIAGATQAKNNTSIYIKILMNHFQLVLLVSSFNFQWPPQLLTFFAATSPVSSASTQVVSIDCFMAAKSGLLKTGESYFDTYFLKLGIFALMPVILAVISYLFWWVQKCINSGLGFQAGKAMATIVVSLFTVHPNIVQTMFDDFNCVSIDGDSRIYTDMTIQCYHPAHSFWSFTVAMPSIVVWGLGIPLFAFVMMFRARKELDTVATKEKFGFLYAGYQQQYFYWEIVIMYRKIAMIFISVFISAYGVICQALIVFLLMIIFLVATLKKKPYLAVALNDLELISLLTSSLSIYCGFFFISSIPEADMANLPAAVKGGIALSDNMKLFLFGIILIANLSFFGFWAYKMFQEIKASFIKKAEKLYLMLCLCGDRSKLASLKNKMMIDEESEMLREKYFFLINDLKNVYKEGKLVLTHQKLERASVYLNRERYLEVLGIGKREITQQEQRRYNRVAHGAEIRHNEQNKGEFTEEFRKNMDMRRKNGRSGPIDPRQHIAIDDEYLYGMKGSKGGKTLKIMPEKFQNKQNNSESGYSNDDQRISSSRQTTHQVATEQKMFETSSLYDEEVIQVTSAVNIVANNKGQLERGLNPTKVIKNGKKLTSPKQQKNRVQASFDSSIQSDAKDVSSQMWENSENEINMGSTSIHKDHNKPKKMGKDPNAGLEDYLNINMMLQKGDIQLQTQKVSNYRRNITQSKVQYGEGDQLRRKPTDKAKPSQVKATVKPAPIVKQEEKKVPQLKIDDDIDFYMGNKSIDDEQDEKIQKKKKQDSSDGNSDIFSD